MNWFFELVGDTVQLQARLEDGEMLGDAYTEIHEGDDFHGVSFDALRDAGSGVVEVDDDGIGQIVVED